MNIPEMTERYLLADLPTQQEGANLSIERLVLFQKSFQVVRSKPGGGGGTPQLNIRGGLARRSESKTPKYLSKNSNIEKVIKSYRPKYS